MSRRFSRSEKGKGQAPPELPVKRIPVRVPANDCDDLIAANRLTVIGRLTNTQIQKSRAENDCPHRPHNALPPKDRVLGITQSIALQRIEAEKRRHDERRGYRRPDEMHAAPRSHAPNSSHFERERAPDMRPHSRLEEHRRDRSILSRTARSQSDYHRRGAPSMQYRVVEKSRFSSDSSAPQHIAMNRPTRVDSTGHIPHVSPRVEHQRGSQRDFTPSRNMSDRLGAPLEITNAQVSNSRVEVIPTRNMSDRLGAPMENANAQISNPRMEITPARNLQSRIEIPSANRENTHSGSREKRPVHERLSDPGVRKPSFDSGRLQRNETLVVEDAQSEHEDMKVVSLNPISSSKQSAREEKGHASETSDEEPTTNYPAEENDFRTLYYLNKDFRTLY
ncbi:Glyoxalase I [Raphanus sativus]|nr:Glyoxalase I [Raphanus sativus]